MSSPPPWWPPHDLVWSNFSHKGGLCWRPFLKHAAHLEWNTELSEFCSIWRSCQDLDGTSMTLYQTHAVNFKCAFIQNLIGSLPIINQLNTACPLIVWIFLGSRRYHKACHKCCSCGKLLAPGKAHMHNGDPHCRFELLFAIVLSEGSRNVCVCWNLFFSGPAMQPLSSLPHLHSFLIRPP